MIHNVHLPALTLERLTDVVVLQIWLLFYAASNSTLDQIDCGDRLNRCHRFRGRGDKIARWIWQAPESRLKPLQYFAQDPTPIIDKRKWVKRLACEAFRLLKKPNGTLEALDNKTRTPWQKVASDFLIGFYENVLREAGSPRKTNPGFPAYIFSGNNPSSFGAQDFLTAFQAANPTLFICPACDESKYSTKAGSIKTDIDHYLPKSKYPHLACHPYNLVPSCPACNQRIKKTSDPLTCQKTSLGTRRKLEDIFCLYRESGLWNKTYLEVSPKSQNIPTEIGSLKAKGGLNIGRLFFTFLAYIVEEPSSCTSRGFTKASLLERGES